MGHNFGKSMLTVQIAVFPLLASDAVRRVLALPVLPHKVIGDIDGEVEEGVVLLGGRLADLARHL